MKPVQGKSMGELAVAVDVGGTFTDMVVYDAAQKSIRTGKLLTTPKDIGDGILGSMTSEGVDLSRTIYFKHGTTTAINTVIERTGAVTAVITNKGFRDVLELGRGNRPDPFNLFWRRLAPLAPRDLRFEVSARMDAQGRELSPVQTGELDRILAECESRGVQAIAVCLLHSYRNPEHEREIGQHLRRKSKLYVSLSHELTREWREYERTSTATVNAYVGPRMSSYLTSLGDRLKGEGFRGTFFLMESNGGVMTGELAVKRPAYLLESGPVAGVVGTAVLARELNQAKAISFDMGGTTAKCALIDRGRMDVTTTYYVGGYEHGYPVQVPVVDIIEVGAGGGSIAHLDATGSLKVGPRSAGSEPGPVAYGRGGTEPTVTDANAALGRFPASGLLGGAMALDTDAARHAIQEKIAGPLALEPEVAASGIMRLAVVTMAAAVRRISIERGHDPRDFVLVVSGGAGPLHAAAIARELSIPTVLVPPLPGHFSAWGMLLADIRFDYAQTFVGLLDASDTRELEEKFAAMEVEAGAALKRTAPNLDTIEFSRYAEMRYAGQEHTVRVPVPADLGGDGVRENIRANFTEAYSQRYGHTDANGKLELVTLRVVGDGIVEKPDLASFAPKATTPGEPQRGHKAYFDDTGWVDCPVYQRDTLMIGQEISGPAIVSETGSTLVIPPGDNATVDRIGNILVRVASRFDT